MAKKILFVTMLLLFFAVLVEIFAQAVFRLVLDKPFDVRMDYLETFIDLYADGRGGYSIDPEKILEGSTKIAAQVRKKDPDVFRIFIVGDSMMAQGSVPQGERTDALVQKRLNASKKTKLTYEVINLSVHGYNIIQASRTIKELIFHLQPDMIIWVLYIHNDFEDLRPNDVLGVQVQEDIQNMGLFLKMAKNTFWLGYIYPRIHQVISWYPSLRLEYIFPKIGFYGELLSYDNYLSLQKRYFKKNFERYTEKIAQTIQLCQTRKYPLKLLLLPEILDVKIPEYYWREESDLLISRVLSKSGLQIIDLREEISRWDIAASTDSTGHFSTKGAQSLSDFLYRLLYRELAHSPRH